MNTPLFFGRLDRERGALEGTARTLMQGYSNKGQWFKAQQVEHINYSFRAELLDQDGSPRENVPVMIEAETSKFVGHIVEGDRVRVEGKFENDGILHASSAFNYSTNSWVGAPK
jgi:hypothetical protein